MNTTKTGHVIMEQNCFNQYCKEDNYTYNGIEYYISNSKILYIYEDTELIFSKELRDYPSEYLNNWAKYFINQLTNTN